MCSVHMYNMEMQGHSSRAPKHHLGTISEAVAYHILPLWFKYKSKSEATESEAVGEDIPPHCFKIGALGPRAGPCAVCPTHQGTLVSVYVCDSCLS